MKEVPVFLLNGFLESGKTTIIKEIIENNGNYQNNTTVIIACEQGEVEYEDEWCEKYGVHVEYVEKQEDFTVEFFKQLDKHYMADQYVVEYNSFFNWDEQEFPPYMAIYQQITMIDTTTFNVYFQNMRQVFQQMIKDSSLVIFNRADGNRELSQYRRWIRIINPQAQIAFEGADGQLTSMLDEDLPYDINSDNIELNEEDYPTWYIEVFDKHDKYLGKTFTLTAFVTQVNKNNTIVVGHQVMTCCAADIQFLGYEVILPNKMDLEVGDYVRLTAKVIKHYSNIAREEVIMLEASKVQLLPHQEEKVLSF